MILRCCTPSPTRILTYSNAAGAASGVRLSSEQLCAAASDLRARALRARELADHVADQEARHGVIRYADDLDREAGRLEAQIPVKKTNRTTIRRGLDAARWAALHSFLLRSRASHHIPAEAVRNSIAK
jgi:hypothetical protein